MERYPTRNGIAIPTRELLTPEDYLSEEKVNNHHNEWTAKRFGKSILYLTVRNMEVHQEMLPKDVHDWLHSTFDVPKFPTPRQAMEEVERGYWNGEMLKIRQNGHYIERPIDKKILDNCKTKYNQYK